MSDASPLSAAGSRAPGVSWQDVFVPPPPPFLTGIPAFLGYTSGPAPVIAPGAAGPDDNLVDDLVDQPQVLTLWSHFEQRFGPPPATGYLAPAVRGFFENGGVLCYVVRLHDAPVPLEDALTSALAALLPLDTVDLICVPDIMRDVTTLDRQAEARVAALQQLVLDHCERRGDRFAILDCLNTDALDGAPAAPNAPAPLAPAAPAAGDGAAPVEPAAVDPAMVEPATVGPATVQGQRAQLRSTCGALYHPWLLAAVGGGNPVSIPPCGHVAGIYSRTDQRFGVHKAPANEAVAGVLDLRHHLSAEEAGQLNDLGVNTIRAFPGRGLRVWGARTLGLDQDPLANYVNVRRLFTTVARWLEQFMSAVSFEANDVRLWLRIMRELSAYCEGLFRQGALKGRTAEEAFYVKCDSDTNPPDVLAAGMVVTELGLAPIAPAEFIVVRIIHGESGVSLVPLESAA